MSVLNRYRANQEPSRTKSCLHILVAVTDSRDFLQYRFRSKLEQLIKTFPRDSRQYGNAVISNGTAGNLPLENETVDYVLQTTLW